MRREEKTTNEAVHKERIPIIIKLKIYIPEKQFKGQVQQFECWRKFMVLQTSITILVKLLQPMP